MNEWHDRLNLPFKLRRRYAVMFQSPETTLNQMQSVQRLRVFDACFGELYKLLNGSFLRFKETDGFAKCVELLTFSESCT